MQDRSTLKYFFRRGAIPTAEQFAELIDSFFHLTEDGIQQDATDENAALTISRNLTMTQPCQIEDNLRVQGDLIVEGDILLTENTSETTHLSTSLMENEPLPPGCIILWQEDELPSGWQVCDGSNDLPDLQALQQLFNQYQPGIRLIGRSRRLV